MLVHRLNLKVLPRKVMTTAELENLVVRQGNMFEFYLSIGDIQSAFQLASGLLSVLNYEAVHENSTANQSFVQSRIKVTIKLVLTPLHGIWKHIRHVFKNFQKLKRRENTDTDTR